METLLETLNYLKYSKRELIEAKIVWERDYKEVMTFDEYIKQVLR